MKRNLIIFLLISTSLLTSLFAEPSAIEIMSLNDSLKEAKSSSNTTTMVLINSRGNKKTRKMKMFSMQTSVGDNTFLEFVLPADVRGTKFLIIGNDQKDDDQRLFLPGLQKVRKISSSNKNGRFMGSDMTYHDMESRNIDDFTYTLLREDTVGDRICWVIESIPVDVENQYSRVLNYISKDNYYIYKKEMYDDDGELLKEVTIVESQVLDGIIFAVKTVIDNIEENHKTLFAVTDIKINDSVCESKFTVQNLR